MSLESVTKKLEKRYGAGVVRAFSDSASEVEVIPSGIVSLDKALMVGGLPRGNMIELFGPPASGKTTLSFHLISQAQKMGLLCLYLDYEHTFDPTYAKNLGISLNEKDFVLSQPDDMEQGMDVASEFLKDPGSKLGVIVVDSIAAMSPRVEKESEIGSTQVGAQSRVFSTCLKQLCSVVKKKNVTFIMINQIRHKIGSFIPTETTPCGEAPKHYASVRVEVRRKKLVKTEERPGPTTFEETEEEKVLMTSGARTMMRIVKSKVGIPYF